MIFSCPYCQGIIDAPEEAINCRIQCYACDKKFKLTQSILHESNFSSKALQSPNGKRHFKVDRVKAKTVKKNKTPSKLPVLLLLLLLAGGGCCFRDELSKYQAAKQDTGQKKAESVQEGLPRDEEALLIAQEDQAGELDSKTIEKGRRKSSSSSFSLSQWKRAAGAYKEIAKWKKENPTPYTSYFPVNKPEEMKKWYVSLGPLGIRTLMHDRSWGIFKACKELQPKVLTDEHGLIFNAYEVLGVKDQSPAQGQIKNGDLIIKIDDEYLKGSQHTYLDRVVDNKNVRGLEIHSGQLIDAAEGRGEISVTVLRLPENMKSKMSPTQRQWRTVKNGNEDRLKVSLKSADLFRISVEKGTRCENVQLINSKGQSQPLMKLSKHDRLVNRPLELPQGSWTLIADLKGKNGTANYKVEVLHEPQFPENLQKYVKTIKLKLPQIGSFGDSYDPHCDKAENYRNMLAHRLAVQQGPDGAWADVPSYASKSFHTSMCGLALMSTENPAYAKHIRQAAHYVANDASADKWTYSHGTWLIFLAEYYLRTGDKEIFPALKRRIKESHKFVGADYTSGHGHSPGYGGTGYIGGGGALACGFAIASKTPAMDKADLLILDKMLERAQEIAPNGSIPYGRKVTWRTTEPKPGQGGSCGTGPYFVASKVRGGVEHFTKTAEKRYSTAPFGSGENGHATQTLHFFWATIATANTNAAAFRQCMDVYLWKFTNLREFDGTINSNNYRTEYHNGDGIIGPPYWRTAGFLIIMNAHKRNLAITGSARYRAPRQRQIPLVFHQDKSAHNFALRNWNIVEAVLGKKTPSSFVSTLKTLRSLKKDTNLGDVLRKLLKAKAPNVARSIMRLRGLPKGVIKEQLVELVLGLAFEASCSPSKMNLDGTPAVKLSGAEEKKRQKLIAKGEIKAGVHELVINPVNTLSADKHESLNNAPSGALFKMTNVKVTVEDPQKKYLKEVKSFEYDDGFVRKSKKAPVQALRYLFNMNYKEKTPLLVHIQYKVLGMKINYTCQMSTSAKTARGFIPKLAEFSVEGTVPLDYRGHYTTRVLLPSGQIIGCEQNKQAAPYLLAGAPYRFVISQGKIWSHELRSAVALQPDYRVAQVSRITCTEGGLKDLETVT
ncbi:MAG: hypothetical protein HRT88_13560, partial [Lentisphaeraceae bacterium]|nr:hypothetical protein [Lentisphaeraceae bacterium]